MIFDLCHKISALRWVVLGGWLGARRALTMAVESELNISRSRYGADDRMTHSTDSTRLTYSTHSTHPRWRRAVGGVVLVIILHVVYCCFLFKKYIATCIAQPLPVDLRVLSGVLCTCRPTCITRCNVQRNNLESNRIGKSSEKFGGTTKRCCCMFGSARTKSRGWTIL